MATSIGSAVSARNQISGTISSILSGPAMSVVTIATDGQELVSAITTQAVQELDLKTSDSVLAFVKSTETMLVKGDASGMQISARNKVSGRVTDLQTGSAMGCVTIDAGGWKLTSAVTRQAIEELQLQPGEPVTAIFKATEVVLQKA